MEVGLGEDQVDDEAVQAVDGGLGSAATRNGDFGIQNSPDVKELRFGEVGECNAVALNFGEDGTRWEGRIRFWKGMWINGSVVDEARFFCLKLEDFLLQNVHG